MSSVSHFALCRTVRTTIPEKLLKVAAQIEEHGSASLTRMTVLKKWFEQSYRLSSFAIFVAKRSCARKGKTTGEAAKLFREARILLAGAAVYRPRVPRQPAERLHDRLRAFQNRYERQQWGSVRVIKNRNLFLIEQGVGIYLWHANSPHDGYRIAASYCEHYDPRYGNGLNGPSCTKIYEIIRFMFNIEALEDLYRPAGG